MKISLFNRVEDGRCTYKNTGSSYLNNACNATETNKDLLQQASNLLTY